MAESSCRLACPPPPSRARLSSFLEHSQHGPRPTMGPSVDPLLDRLIPPSLVELSLARRKLLGPLLLALLLLRTTPVVDLLSNIQIPGRESAERRRERKRIEALTPLTTPVLEKESADLVSCCCCCPPPLRRGLGLPFAPALPWAEGSLPALF